MKPERLLYLSAHQLAAFHWQAGKLTSEGVFPATADGHEAFASYLSHHADSIYALLANVAEEGFQVETIPFLRGADRQSVIRRKLEQQFFNAPLTASHSLGYQKLKRKDERILLAALTNSDFFAPWLAACRAADVALAGLYSLPLLGSELLRRFKLVEPHCLLLTVQDQSIRQSYFENGELHFSRLAPLHQSSIGGIAQTLATETVKLQQYLASQRIIGRSQAITAHILVHPATQKVIESRCVDTATVHFNFLDIVDYAARSGLKTPPADMHGEAFFLNLLAATPPAVQFATDEARHDYHLRQLRFGLHGFAALALVACLLVAGEQLYERYETGQETEQLRSEASLSQRRYLDIAATFPPIPMNNETLVQVVNRYVELAKTNATPNGLFQEISRALASVPQAELDRIDWQVGTVDTGKPSVSGISQAATAVPLDSEAAVIEGRLQLASSASARDVLAIFDSLVDALQANPQLQVSILQRPVDIDSGKSLRGGGDIAAASESRPRAFSVQIMRKIDV